MIILRLNTEEKVVPKQVKRRRKQRKYKEQVFEFSRSGIIINNKPHFVVSVDQSTLQDAEFKALLSRYRGSVIPCEQLEKDVFVNEVSFDTAPFLKKALFSSFEKYVHKKELTSSEVLLIDADLTLKKEIMKIIPYIKKLTIATEDFTICEEWKNQCFFEFGIKPELVKLERVDPNSFQVVADFENLSENKLNVLVNGEKVLFYPDYRFLEIPCELALLEELEVSRMMICAAFKNI